MASWPQGGRGSGGPSTLGGALSAHIRPLEHKEPNLVAQAPAVADEIASRPRHLAAGDNDGDLVAADNRAHCPSRYFGPAGPGGQLLGQGLVGGGLPVGDGA